jgi:CRISPR-associated protein Csd1
MFIQALAQYADENLHDALNDVAWEEKPVRYLIELSSDGRSLGVVERMTPVVRGKKTISLPQSLTVPRSPVNRNSGHHPLLAADDISYVLGVGAWTAVKDEDKHAKHHEAFASILREAAEATRDQALQACQRFNSDPDQVELARAALKEAKPGSLVALSVSGPVVSRPAVRNWWSEHYGVAFKERVGSGAGECLISGKFGPIAPTHEKIKGTGNLGGQPAGVSLMSFDKDAFQSYGWDQNENSPVSPDRAMAYVLALNDLLRSDKGHRRDLAGVGFIFWLKNPVEFDVFLALERPSEKQVADMLALDPGVDPDLDPNEFYLAGVSGNGGRLRVRYWVTDTLERIKNNLNAWFEGLRVAKLYGEPVEPVRFWQLLQAIDREGEPPANCLIALVRRAIEGPAQPLGYPMLATALGRLRKAKATEWTPARLGLIRMCVNDVIDAQQKGERRMTESLDTEQLNPAYLCGRLLAEYEGLQFQASNAAGESKVNLSVADRYYSLASTYPAIAFPKIVDLGQKHLRKLRRDRPGAANAIGQRIEELCGVLGQEAHHRFPAMLSLEDQGRFALGYQHQRAYSTAQAKASKEAKLKKEAEEIQNQEDQETTR